MAAVVNGSHRVRLSARPPDSPKARPCNSTNLNPKEDISIRLTQRTFLNSSDSESLVRVVEQITHLPHYLNSKTIFEAVPMISRVFRVANGTWSSPYTAKARLKSAL